MGGTAERTRNDSPPPEPSDFLIYRALLEPTGTSLADWMRQASRGGTNAGPLKFRSAIDRLRKHGLLCTAQTNDRQLRPNDPEVVEKTLVSQLLDQAELSLRQVNQLRTELIPAKEAYRRAQSTEEGWLLRHSGPTDIGYAVTDAAQRCAGNVVSVQPASSLPGDLPEAALLDFQEMLERGVGLRSLYQHSARADQIVRCHVRDVQELGGEVRTLDESVSWLLVFDGECAFIPAAAGEAAALEIRSPGIVAFLTMLFERDWLRATPFTLPGRDELTAQISDELTLAILRHVVAGDTDSVTAQQLGISVRRCQEYVARAARELGSRSRAQLGYLVARSGLLDDHWASSHSKLQVTGLA
ncbi:helix-turn-helix domain-containing protein [Streptomyces halobius]|uniref:HTH luxR-type domain-containing protein n=1 Tax=Streptomyces halobius TaxID=2879846 RepID=A0ABY4M7J2_9ACTN|nr:hypothetical protein [Streptomyces halobius]UQA93717.1 hypothetical protein K9S39_19265 [Streptomyces halobius]